MELREALTAALKSGKMRQLHDAIRDTIREYKDLNDLSQAGKLLLDRATKHLAILNAKKGELYMKVGQLLKYSYSVII